MTVARTALWVLGRAEVPPLGRKRPLPWLRRSGARCARLAAAFACVHAMHPGVLMCSPLESRSTWAVECAVPHTIRACSWSPYATRPRCFSPFSAWGDSCGGVQGFCQTSPHRSCFFERGAAGMLRRCACATGRVGLRFRHGSRCCARLCTCFVAHHVYASEWRLYPCMSLP